MARAYRIHVWAGVLSLAFANTALAQPPRIVAFTPQSGPPGTLVKIIGERLDMVDDAYFGGVEAMTIRHVSDLHIKVVVPDGARTGPIGLINRDGLRAYTLRPFEIPTTPVPPVPLAFSPALPTPSAGSVTLRFTLPAQGHARLSVFDVRGRRVRILADGVLDAGLNERVWDGRDERGASVPGGLFFARLDAEGETLLRRIALIR